MTGSRKRGARDRSISDDEAALWDTVAATAKRLRLKPRVVAHEVPDADAVPARRAAKDRAAAPADAKRKPVRGEPAAKPPPVRAAAPVPLADFDRRTARRIAAGRIEIEARLDLHGERQSTAHGLLRQFLRDQQARGRRTVLVITGKGQRGADDEAARPLMDSGGGRGVLKRQVPLWLGEPDLRGVVLSYTQAAPRHGGDGALYVHLRRAG